MFRWIAAFIVLAAAMSALALQGPRSAIVVEGNLPRCVDGAKLEHALTQRLGYDPFVADPTLHVVIDLQGTSGDVDARVAVYGPARQIVGERQLHASDCAVLDEQLMLVLGIALAADVEPEVPHEPAPPAATSIEASKSLPAVAPTQHPSSVSWRLGVAVGAGIDLVPSLSIGTTLAAEAHWSRFSLGLEGSFVFPTSWSTAQDGSYTEQLLLISAVPCVTWGPFGGCALASAGAAHVKGAGYSDSQATTTPYVALGVRGSASLPLSDRWILRGQIDLLAPIVKPTIQLGQTDLWTQPPINGALGVALLVRID